jgi:hypothetical protein
MRFINKINTISIISGLFLALSLHIAVANNIVNPTKALLIFPTLPYGTAIYMYDCGTSNTCATPIQSSKYGYITNVPLFYGNAPATWITLDTEGANRYYQLWRNTGTANAPVWQTCQLGILASGDIATDSSNTCIGAVKIESSSSPEVSQISLGAAMFPTPDSPITPSPFPHNYIDIPTRTISFQNSISDTNICIDTDGSFAHTLCSGQAVKRINANTTTVYSVPKNGDNSRVAQVIGLKKTKGVAPWQQTGNNTKGGVYATNLEWDIYPVEAINPVDAINPAGAINQTLLSSPQITDHSYGPTTIDISLVNGFNVGVSLIPKNDVVCAVSAYENGPSIFNLYLADQPMAVFPELPDTSIKALCPTGFNAGKSGCYSQCKQAIATKQSQDIINQNCCSGGYDTYATCAPVINDIYINAVTDNSTGVYAWPYDDYRGTFTCQGDASFTFKVTAKYK